MKKFTMLLIALSALLMTSCGKRPYQTYKSTYKTDGAKTFNDDSISPAEATKKSIKHMTLAEVRAARIYFEEHDDFELLEKVLSRTMKMSDNYQERADCLYELATIQLAFGRLEKARELFEELLRDYPGIAFKKEALYRQILAHYWDCNDAERDQEMTEKTLALVQDFLKEFPAQSSYEHDLETIQTYCYTLLFQAEFSRMDFYIQRYRINNVPEALTAGHLRFTYIIEKLLEYQKNIDSAEKDALVDLCVQLKALDADALVEKYNLLCQAITLLTIHYDK